MMNQQIQTLVEASSLKAKKPAFEIGDTVDVHTRILEGDKERVQIFNGVVIAISGAGSREMFTVRRIVAGEGVERKFPLHSPKVAKVVVKRKAVVRRAKLYFLRDRVGKATRLKERPMERVQEDTPKVKKGRKAKRARKRAEAEANKNGQTATSPTPESDQAPESAGSAEGNPASETAQTAEAQKAES